MTPNIRGVDLDFETLEEKNEMAPNLRGVICNLLFNLNLSAYPQELKSSVLVQHELQVIEWHEKTSFSQKDK